jgi:probable F420-dependent oxidoreductase
MSPARAMRVALNMLGTEAWFGGDIQGVIELVEIADGMGADLIGLPEHVAMGDDLSAYPYHPSPISRESDRPEPMVLLAALAGRTRQIRLATSVLLIGLRPAVLIAKQIATLDVISGGRVELSVGVGWQKAEYEFEGIPWDGRFGRMIETIEACRELWSQCPASYLGRHVNFTRAYSKPFPIQGRNIPILLGVAPTEANIERLARTADGWEPVNVGDEDLQRVMARIRGRMAELGRDPASFRLKLILPPVKTGPRTDLTASLAQLPRLAALGATIVNVRPAHFCEGPADFEPILEKVLQARDQLNATPAPG